MFLLLALSIVMMWGLMGTVTYRRLGGYRIAHALPEHASTCGVYNKPPIKDRGASYAKCTGCDGYLHVMKLYPDSNEARTHKVSCAPQPCNCTMEQRKAQVVKGAAKRAYTLWPGYVAAYAAINASKAYTAHKGEDWSFFVEPKMVQTKTERQEKLDSDIDRLQKTLDSIKIEALTGPSSSGSLRP